MTTGSARLTNDNPRFADGMLLPTIRAAITGFQPSPTRQSSLPPIFGDGTARAAAWVSLHRQASRWLLLGALAYRVLALPVALIVYMFGQATHTLTTIVTISLALLAANLSGLVWVYRRSDLDLWQIRWTVLADLCLAYAINALAWPYVASYSGFWAYLTAAIALVTGAYGLTGGVVAALLTIPVQLWTADGAVDLASALVGFGWLALTAVVAVVLLVVSGLSLHLAMANGIRAGRDAERARLLRSMHDTVLQTLEAIALDSSADQSSPEAALAQARHAARAQACRLRRTLTDAPGAASTALSAALTELADEFTARGLRIEFTLADGAGEKVCRPHHDVLVAAAREALANVVKHAGVACAVLRVSEEADGVVMVIRDHGRGFDPAASRPGFGITQSILARVHDIGGEATIESWPGRGTRVTMRAPA